MNGETDYYWERVTVKWIQDSRRQSKEADQDNREESTGLRLLLYGMNMCHKGHTADQPHS